MLQTMHSIWEESRRTADNTEDKAKKGEVEKQLEEFFKTTTIDEAGSVAQEGWRYGFGASIPQPLPTP